jgi:hypothetical protein
VEAGRYENFWNGRVDNDNLENRKKQMLYSIGDSLSEVASLDNKVNGEEEWDDEEDSEVRKQREDDEPCWVIETFWTMVTQCMESFWLKLGEAEELRRRGWGYKAN